MIEVPQLPAVGCVAGSAVLAQTSLVNIILCMTIDALLGGLLEPLRRVTLTASDNHMESEQREAREVVIESYIVPPGLPVTLLALRAQCSAVRLVGPMAASAFGAELLILRDARMTSVAIEVRVRPLEREVKSCRVIEARHPPAIISVTVRTIRPKPSGVAVVCLVTTVAILRDGLLEIAAAVAILAAEARVSSH